ncbi:MAG: hypothetical protein H7Z72_00805 [Bacteroidetes bacterium]|nr:hypothetical protein [Fibrella sp.]
MTGYTDNTGTNAPSSTGTSRMMTAIFDNRDAAEKAYDALLAHGFSKDDVNLVMSDETRKQNFENNDTVHGDSDLGDKAMEGAGKGSAIGGTVGAVAAAIAAIGTSLVVPGLGLVVAGPIAAALAGAGVGGLAGGLVGALVGSGVPEETAKAYESGLKSGGIVVGVHPRNAADEQYLTQQGFH